MTHFLPALAQLERAVRPWWTVVEGDCRDVLPTLRPKSVRCIVTSPPYFLLRQYAIQDTEWGGNPYCEHIWLPFVRPGVSGGSGEASRKSQLRKGNPNYQLVPDTEQARCTMCGRWRGQLGLEPTLDQYLRHLTDIFALCRDVLADDGTLWVNISDSWSGSGKGPQGGTGMRSKKGTYWVGDTSGVPRGYVPKGMKPKDLMGIPESLARYMREDGWYWRANVIWHKPNGGMSSVNDRPAHTYENVLLFSKSRSYFYHPYNRLEPGSTEAWHRLRDVWSISPEPTGFQHYAAFPRALARRCILLSTLPGDLVLDPFAGIARAGMAALETRRSFVGVELGVDYAREARRQLGEWEQHYYGRNTSGNSDSANVTGASADQGESRQHTEHLVIASASAPARNGSTAALAAPEAGLDRGADLDLFAF